MVPRGLSEDNLSQHTDIQLWGSQEEDNEEPPPPYPGNSTSCDAGTTDYIVSPRPTRPDTITMIMIQLVKIGPAPQAKGDRQ